MRSSPIVWPGQGAALPVNSGVRALRTLARACTDTIIRQNGQKLNQQGLQLIKEVNNIERPLLLVIIAGMHSQFCNPVLLMYSSGEA